MAVYRFPEQDDCQRSFPRQPGSSHESGRRRPSPQYRGIGGHTPSSSGPSMRSPIAPDQLHSVDDAPRQTSHSTSFPVSPRWDSLSSGSCSAAHSPTSPSFGPGPSRQQLDQRGRRPDKGTFRRKDAFGTVYEPRSQPSSRSPSRAPSRPLTSASSARDLRAAQDAVANFSRPRKHSIRQPAPEPIRLPPSCAVPGDLTSNPNIYTSPPSASWQRSRGPSVSSFKSPSGYAPPQTPKSAEVHEPLLLRMRNPIGPPPLASRPPPSHMHSDHGAHTPATSPSPWVGRDDLRSSLRSQMTVSTDFITGGTERSSILTKDSSATSLEPHPDEPSLEDVMGMYEKGFNDDSEHETDKAEDGVAIQPAPATAITEPSSGSFKPWDDDDSDVATLPEPPSLAAEIRQSKLLFSNSAFMNSLAHVADQDEEDDVFSMGAKRVGVDRAGSRRSSLPGAEADGPESLTSPIEDESDAYLAQTRDTSPLISSPLVGEATETELPGSRDRYGFKKENQYISRQQYDAWDRGYSTYLARRRRKWVTFLKDSALITDRPKRFPPPTAKTKKFIRKGIPPDWRGAAWFYYAGGPAILAKHSGLYEKLLHMKARREDVDAIERDLHRTFPDNVEFKPPKGFSIGSRSGRSSHSTATGLSSDQGSAKQGEDATMRMKPDDAGEDEPPIISSLRRVLFAFSIYNPRIGYCQSLNFIAGLLLLFVDTEEQCFWLLNVITHIYLPGTHEISLEGSKVDLSVLMSELKDTMPGVWDKIGGELEGGTVSLRSSRSLRRVNPLSKRKGQAHVPAEKLPPITLCMTAWFMSCFIGTLPIETTLRVWDVFFYEGSKTLFRVALAILKLGEPEIKAVKDPMEMFGVVQSMPRKMIDANTVLDACFKRRNGFGHLSQGAIDERRQERRDHGRQEGRSRPGTSGNGTDAEGQLRRKGTLFGMRKRSKETTQTRWDHT